MRKIRKKIVNTKKFPSDLKCKINHDSFSHKGTPLKGEGVAKVILSRFQFRIQISATIGIVKMKPNGKREDIVC